MKNHSYKHYIYIYLNQSSDWCQKVKKFMDSDPSSKTQNEKSKNSHNLPDGGNVLQSTWIRRSSVDLDSINRFIIESQFKFVLPCSILLWIVFLLLRE